MSESEIHYQIPKSARSDGDVEEIVNAIGSFQSTLPFPAVNEYNPLLNEAAGDVVIKLVHTFPVPKYDHDLLEDTARMQRGVDAQFPDEKRARLARHFTGIAIRDAIEVEKP